MKDGHAIVDPKQRYIFTCSACDAPLKALAEHLGRQVACPSCGRVISVPAKAKPSVEGEDWWAVDIPDTGEDFFDAALPETAPVQPPVNKPAKPANPAPGTQRPEGSKQPAARPTASNPSPSKPTGNSAAPPARTPPATGSSPSGSSARPPSSAPRTTNPGQPAAPNSPRPAQRPASNTASGQANPGQANPAPAKPPAAGAKPAGQQPAGPGKSNTSALRGNAPASGPPAPVRRPPAPPPQPEELDADNLFGELPPAHGSNDTDPMEWLKQHGYGGALDDDFNDPLAPAATSGSEASNQYRARCRVCDAVIMVRPTQAGKQIRCPDCHSHFEVPPPPEGQSAASQAAPQAVKHDDALERPIHTDAYGKSAQDYMRAAEAAPQEKVDELFDNPDVKGWAKDIFGMFMDPG